jgi:hypothetical protein
MPGLETREETYALRSFSIFAASRASEARALVIGYV